LGAEKSQHSAGWYAGALVFWLLSAWLTTVGLSSIIPQIFWPNGDARSAAASCRPALRALQDELTARVSSSIASASSDSDRPELLAWFDRWDKRLYEARSACTPDEDDAWVELVRARHGMQALLERFARDEAPRLQRLHQLLGAQTSLGDGKALAQPLEDHTP
jgi:hypothetical protein